MTTSCDNNTHGLAQPILPHMDLLFLMYVPHFGHGPSKKIMHMITQFHVSRGIVTILVVVHIGHIFQGTFELLLHTLTFSTHATWDILESSSSFITFGDVFYIIWGLTHSFDVILVVGGFMTHFLTWRVTPILHGGSLTLGMDMVMLWRDISRIYGHYLSLHWAHFVEAVPF